VDAEDGKLHVLPNINATTVFMPFNRGGKASVWTLSGNPPNFFPAAVSIDAGTGAITVDRFSLDPVQYGPFEAVYLVTATNGGLAQTQSVTIFIENLAPYHLSAPNLTLFTGQAMSPTTLAFRSGGNAGNLTWSANLPAGLSLAANAPVLSGTPGQQLPSRSVFNVTSAAPNRTAIWPITLRVVDPIPVRLSYADAPACYAQGQAVSNAATLSPGGDVAWTFALAQGSPALPAGLSLDPATGLVSGTAPGADLDTTCTIQAYNSAGYAINFPLRIRVGLGKAPTLAYTIAANRPGNIILASQVDPLNPLAAVARTSNAAGAQFSALPSLPAGLSMDANGTLTFAGAPAPGSYDFLVLMTTSSGAAASRVQFTVQP
jgi:hypothetical protein